MNYRYRLIDAEYVLTEAEHQYCVVQFKKGTNICSLRGDTLLINMAMLKSASKTDQPTDEEERRRGRQLQLDKPQGAGGEPANIPKVLCDFRTKQQWDHPAWCLCNQKHESIP